ncbi:MAG TPA: c-type cytochrome [Zoogloea sp.]|uniref:c-type cytochrome n=2 Tax=Zoogloea sp. TaxID=49181 RepID=UPI002D1B4DE1|nr:c-type cytochrome [Zoogloea sp.]HMW51840.1 c-type cytochrome [Rhodocyclaceae bacterium]HNI48179.1 c-type cytochrome [Zoogloea sp.]
MSRFSRIPLALVALVALGLAGTAVADGKFPGVGRPATAAEVRAWDIDVRPDFKGLRPGSGSVDQGQEVWEAKCASCHGTFGESNEVHTPLIGGTTQDDIRTGHVASLAKGDVPQRTAIMKVATVSTLFDYINRAMPLTAPKSLKNDEVYALLAYLLNLAEVVPADFVLSDRNIAEVQQRMPNRKGMTTDHGMWPGASAARGGIGNGGTPDVKNTACMHRCKDAVQVASLLPAYAETAHGNLAEQNRSVGPVRGKETGARAMADAKSVALSENAAMAKLAGDSGCMACHGLASRVVGPGYNEVATRYTGQPDAEAKLAAKVKAGGQGVWGAIPMPPQSQLKDGDVRSLVKWILSGAKAQ